MRRLVLPLLVLLLMVSCTTANLRKNDPNRTASTEDFDVQIYRAIFPDLWRSDWTADAHVILSVTNNTDETYTIDRVSVQGTGGLYYVPLTTKNASRTILAGHTESFNLKVMAVSPDKVTRDLMKLQTTIEAHPAGREQLREETFTASVRPYTVHTYQMGVLDWTSNSLRNGFRWDYNASTHYFPPDTPPQGLPWTEPAGLINK